jgi:agmatinase
MLGGEHLVTYGAARAASRAFPELSIVHFDAHADLRDEYLGERLSHATVMRRCWELTGDGSIFQFGIRSGDREEFEFAKAHTRMRRFSFDGLGETLALPALADRPVYLTIDLDVLDPGEFPGTGTPEAGGVRFLELLGAASAVLRECRVIGLDLVELSPPCDPSGASTSLVCKLLRELLLRIRISE